MRMKKQTLVGSVAAIALMLATWWSLAYYVTSETTHNVISSGGIDIELVETAIDGSGELVPFQNPENLLPGETLSKIPEVKNDGHAAAFVRTKIDLTVVLADGTTTTVPEGLIGVNYNTAAWHRDEDGYFYYYEPLPGQAQTEKLFDTVAIASELGNIYKDATFRMVVSAEAVQAANNGITAEAAEGWEE